MEKYRQIRNYEVSVWTLQDSFITVLKWAGIESKGQIQNGIQILDIDGTQEFTFTIPMYLSNPDVNGNNIKKENPIWYNTKNGVLMASMRKIKVILNKQTNEEKVYEYLITKVNERHEKGELYCDVSCEGLAFHELGKTGYKLALSSDDFYYDYDEWFSKDGSIITEPHQTIQYWNNKFLTPYPEDSSKIIPNVWYYEVRMNWASSGEHENKYSNKIYEEEYVSSWDMIDDTLIPKSFSKLKEKERAIDIEESNIYNITQKIAEIFEVFCKYEYEYDENYHIIARKVVYYNSLIEEQNGYLNLTYPYHTSKITREMDGTDLVTKMYIQVQGTDMDTLNIMDVAANKSKEDYILNFDYLHELKIITEEQYLEIEKYEKAMFKINQELSTLNNQINVINNQLLNESSNKATAEKGLQSAENQINIASNNLKTLGANEDGTITIDGFNSKPLIMIKDESTGEYSVNMPFVGIIPTSVTLIAGTLNYSNPDKPFGEEEDINKVMGEMEYDEYNNLIKITHLSSPETYDLINPVLWLQCKYLPYTYWNNVYNYWVITVEEYKEKLKKAKQNITKLKEDLEEKEARYKELLKEKNKEKNHFNQVMGTALREGYWQPENYLSYNNKFLADFDSPDSSPVYQEHAAYFWDTNLLKEEKDATFKQGNITRQYLMINLIGLSEENLNYIKNNYDNLSFIYYDSSLVQLNENLSSNSSDYQNNAKKALHSIHLNGGCKFGFIINNNIRIPVLIITDSSLFTDEQLSFFSNDSYTNYKSKLGVIQRTLEDQIVNINIDENAIDIEHSQYIYGGNYQDKLRVVSPKTIANLRIIIDSLALNTSSTELFIKLDGILLQEYNDYYITKDYDKVYITIKPEVLFRIGNLNPSIKLAYSLSNTDVAVYLDAIKIAKENAYPKTSYEVDLNIFDGKIIHNIYNRLSQIVHINDNELKFENVQGYISRVEMDLDHPWQDKIEVKNYKTKFEDLFSTIIASTEAIKRNEYNYNLAAAAFNNDGTINSEVLSESLNNNSFIIDNYLNSNFDGIEIINKKLENIFNEAGVLLSTAGNSLNNLHSLSINNASILSGFYNGIQEGFANGIDYTKEITLVSGDKTNISAIRINKDEGIYIGSNNKIILSATNAIQGENGEYIGDPGLERSGADVELSPDRLLMGVSNLTSDKGGVVDITSDQIILAVGNNVQILQNDPSSEITADKQDESGSPYLLSGVQIKNNYIGLATGNEKDRGLVSIRPTDITLGVSNNEKEGSYVKIAKTGIELGSSADLYINTNNFKLQTNANNKKDLGNTIFAIGSNLNNVTQETDIKDLTGNSTINFLVNQNGAYIRGNIYAESLNLITSNGSKAFNEYIQALESRIDDEVQTWFGKGTPQYLGTTKTTSPLTRNVVGRDGAATDPTGNDATKPIWTIKDNAQHVGDIYYDIAESELINKVTYSETGGAAFRFIKDGDIYKWQEISDTITTSTAERMERIRNGEVGLAFTNSGGNSFVTLNNTDGLVIMGKKQTTGTYKNYYPFFRATNNAMGFFYSKSASSAAAPTNDDVSMLYFEDGEMYVRGNITASSFSLNGNNFDQAVSSSSLANEVSNIKNNISNITVSNITVSYYANNYSKTQTQLNQLNDNDWKGSVDNAIEGIEKPYYLYTRSVTTYSGGNRSTAYSISYVGKDGEQGEQGAPGDSTAYITTITPLYYLTNSSSAPDKPSDNVKITDTSTEPGGWRTVVPTYKEDYEYYRCTQYEWSEGADNQVTHSNVYKDPGLTAMYKYATDASIDAARAVSAIEPLTVNGLSSGIWNGTDYGVILGNESTSKPMLIGSNSGITIAADTGNPSKGEAISLTNEGIALHGATINLTSVETIDEEEVTSVISMSGKGINLASTAEINMKSGGAFNVQASMGTLTFKDENNNELTFSVDPDGTVRCKKLYCDELIVDNISTNDGKTVAKTEDSTQSAEGEITTSSFSPNTGYLPGNQGRSGSFTTYPVFNGSTTPPEGYSLVDISLYFTTQDSGYWSVGVAKLFINDKVEAAATYISHNSSDGSRISFEVKNYIVKSGERICLKITNTVSNQANYIATYSFVPYMSSVKIHN